MKEKMYVIEIADEYWLMLTDVKHIKKSVPKVTLYAH